MELEVGDVMKLAYRVRSVMSAFYAVSETFCLVLRVIIRNHTRVLIAK